MSVGSRIKELRNSLDLTQQKFADRLGIQRGIIGKYEVDVSAPSDAVISLICRVFNVREAWLRDGTGEMLEQLTEDEDRARFFGGLSKENASPEVLAFIDALRKTPEPAIRAALEFVCNVYESYNALQIVLHNIHVVNIKKRTELIVWQPRL